MILTVGNTKGGTGKSTIAINLAIARAASGRKVWLIDGDRQGTAKTAMTIRAASGRLPLIQCDQFHDGKVLHDQLKANNRKFDDVVIDAGGRDSTALRAALVLSDLVLIPFAPRSLDVWALSDINALIDEAKAINPALKAAAVLSCADIAGTDNQDAVDALADFPQLNYMPAPIRRRKSIANAAGQGLSVLELLPKDAKAIEELKTLSSAVFMPI